MGILFSEVKYYRSADINFDDNTLNGGDVGDEIVNDTLHSIFPEISATQRENGVVLRSKIFVKNESVDRLMQDCIFYVKQDVQPEDRLRLYSATGQANHEDDEDFGALKPYINSVTKSTVTQGSTTVDIPIIDKPLFIIGDNIILIDGYFRAVFRGEILDIQDHTTNAESATITLSKAYTSSVTIPSMEGYIGNGDKQTLSPGDIKSMWIELTVASTNAIDAEIVNQFQVGTHFDDVAS